MELTRISATVTEDELDMLRQVQQYYVNPRTNRPTSRADAIRRAITGEAERIARRIGREERINEE